MSKQTKKSAIMNLNDELNVDRSPASFVARIAKILDCLGDGVYSVTEISKICNLSTSTTHRLLNALKEPQLTIYEPSSHRYHLGPRVAKLALKPRATHQTLVMFALNEMKRLSDVTEETISLDLAIGIQLVHIFAVYTKHRFKILEETREVQPVIPSGAAQKVLLSQLNEKDLRFALKTAANWVTDEHYVSDANVIIPQLSQIKQQGYAVTRGEAILGALGISAPVKHYFCPAALTILGPENRMLERVPGLIKELIVSADKISRDILEFLDTMTG